MAIFYKEMRDSMSKQITPRDQANSNSGTIKKIIAIICILGIVGLIVAGIAQATSSKKLNGAIVQFANTDENLKPKRTIKSYYVFSKHNNLVVDVSTLKQARRLQKHENELEAYAHGQHYKITGSTLVITNNQLYGSKNPVQIMKIKNLKIHGNRIDGTYSVFGQKDTIKLNQPHQKLNGITLQLNASIVK